ncbi:hypothetical protein [uncultured Rhodoferax sp.]|uniref:hypothetical protein n=1 Tax=uncultured Rhodoferax sp. TaxID=223188 RepID=UPI0025E056E3|nr:hypothetical protein [uncultured Rhodoferax sp.]
MTRFIVAQLRARIRRFDDFCYRVSNYRHYRAKGLAPAHAWKKADITLPPTKTAKPWR